MIAVRMNTTHLNDEQRIIKQINFTLECFDHDDSSRNISHQNPTGWNP
jgi:hypothetical protein